MPAISRESAKVEFADGDAELRAALVEKGGELL